MCNLKRAFLCRRRIPIASTWYRTCGEMDCNLLVESVLWTMRVSAQHVDETVDKLCTASRAQLAHRLAHISTTAKAKKHHAGCYEGQKCCPSLPKSVARDRASHADIVQSGRVPDSPAGCPRPQFWGTHYSSLRMTSKSPRCQRLTWLHFIFASLKALTNPSGTNPDP
jgi:hypothetical protein